MKLERTSLILLLSRISTTGLGFLGTIYYARELGAAVIGTFFLVQSLVGIFSVPADLGVQGAAEKRISEGGDSGELFTSAVLLMLLSYTVISLLVVFFSEYVSQYLGAQLIQEILVLLLVSIVSQLALSLLRGELKIGLSAVLEGIRATVTLIISAALIFAGYEVEALIYGVVAGSVSLLPVAWAWTETRFALPSKRHVLSIFSFSKYNMLLRTSGLIYNWLDVLVIGFFLSQSHVGIYEVAWKVSSVSILVSSSISQVIFPNFSKLFSNGKLEEIEQNITDAITYSLIIPIAVFFGSLPLASELLSLVYGAEFGAGAVVLIILLAERLVHAFYNTIYSVMMAGDRPREAFKISVISIGVNVGLTVVLVPIYGIAGAAIAMLISYVINAALYYFQTMKLFNMNIVLPINNIAWLVGSAGLMTGTVWVLKSVVAAQSIVTLGALISAGGITYVVLLSANRELRDRFTALLPESFGNDNL